MVHKKKLLTRSIALALAGVSMNAMAQEALAIQEVVVTGIRGSLERSMDMKRYASGVIDGISAEDIGKMPDTNLAEALQRITGVSIDRQNGEGSRVTVRGFGPDFNLVTLNGRQMPSANVEDTAASSSRSFDFANLAAESVSGVEVYKTGKASLTTGGIGSLINIKTARPLNNPDGIASVSVKLHADSSNDEGSDTTPELSGIFSQTFADDTIGISISASVSERDSGYNKAHTGGGWFTIPGDQGDWGSVPANSPDFTNAPQAGDIYAVPRTIDYEFNQIQRERTNAQLTLQWAPSSDITATLDYTYSELDVETQRHEMGAWFNGVPQSGEFTQGTGNGSIVAPVIYTDGTGADITFATGEWGRVSENNSIGLNVEWNASDNLSLVFDYHNSDAENGAKDDRGTANKIAGVQFNRLSTTVDYSQDVPVTSFEYIDGQGFDPALMQTSGNSFRNSYMKHDIEQAKIDGQYTFDDSTLQSVDFGISVLESTNRSAYSAHDNGTWGGYATPADYDDGLFTPKDLSSQFDQLSGSSNPNFEANYYETDFQGARDAIAAIAIANGDDLGACGPVLCADPNFTTDRTTTEDQTSLYVQANFAWEGAGMPMNASWGLRYEDTDVKSTAMVPIYNRITWESDNEFTAIFDDVGTTSGEGSYDYLLPNIDFDVSVTDDLVLRASASKTLSRPSYADLQGGRSVNNPVRLDGGTGSQGNPALAPFVSNNMDLSAEFYYGEGSYVSVGFYQKNVENFIGTTTVNDTVFDLAHPGQGDRYDAAVIATGSTDNAVVRAYMEGEHGTPLTGDASLGDPSAVFSLTTPVNARDASIDGLEIAVQHMFGDSGFGLVANMTTVNGDIEYDNFNTNKGAGAENQFALLGLSDSANLIGFYDKDGIQARIAYNWRDDFLTATVDGNNERNPVYTEGFGQIDISLSYDVTEDFSVSAEGINITNETQRLYGRHPNMVIGAIQTGARYSVGARYKF